MMRLHGLITLTLYYRRENKLGKDSTPILRHGIIQMASQILLPLPSRPVPTFVIVHDFQTNVMI